VKAFPERTRGGSSVPERAPCQPARLKAARRGRRAALSTALAVALAGGAIAQDRRQVVEPRIPPACAVLNSSLPLPPAGELAEADEQALDTLRIQRSLDACPAGRAVVLRARPGKPAFLTALLRLRAGVALVIDAGAVVLASRNPRDYDVRPGLCGTLDDSGDGCHALISGDGVADAAVMGGGMIDGRGGARLLGQTISWWDLAQEASRRRLVQNVPRLIVLQRCDNFTLYRITLRNSPNFHVVYAGGDGFTAWGVTIYAPQTARNTDGIDPISATNVTITHCFIHAGDDHIAIKADELGAATHMTIAHNHFYAGHGMAIGSDTYGGVSAIRVTDLSIDGADNGIRIKSNSTRGGRVQDVEYEDVCIRDTNYPILMDSKYSFNGAGRNLLPSFTGIVLRNVHVTGPGKVQLQGYDAAHRLGMQFDNLVLSPPASIEVKASDADLTLGPGPVNFLPEGRNVRVLGAPGDGPSIACEDKFVPLPR